MPISRTLEKRYCLRLCIKVSNARMSIPKTLEQRGLQTIEEYIEIASREILIIGISESYLKHYAKILLYAPSTTRNYIKQLNTLLQEAGDSSFPDEKACTQLLIQISESFSKKLN